MDGKLQKVLKCLINPLDKSRRLPMRSALKLVLLMTLFCFSLLAACQQEEEASLPQNSGVVTATQAYLDNFGVPPQGKAGQAFARVGYLPLQKNPEKLRAVPLFLFSEAEQLQQILDRLISGELLLYRDTVFYNPFPNDLKVSVTSPEGPTTTLSLTTQQSLSASDLSVAAQSLAETVLQFAQVERVIVLNNGVPLPQMPQGGYLRVPELLTRVEPPQLVLMAGVWEAGEGAPHELLIEFDRPIKVNSFKLYESDGNVVDGEYFTSIFKMAIVVHPKDPGRYQEKTVLRAEWDVIDILGRANQGTDSLPIRRIDH
jgi:hypothetical protein